jgi:hypothetical protein
MQDSLKLSQHSELLVWFKIIKSIDMYSITFEYDLQE